MPIYGYACKNCDHRLNELQKIADAPLIDCPECGKPELKRQLSAPRFRLKGQGWYETDFKKDNQRNLAADKEPVKANESSDNKHDKKEDKKEDKKVDKKTATPATKKADSKTSAA